jgi:hypothetical protein
MIRVIVMWGLIIRKGMRRTDGFQTELSSAFQSFQSKNCLAIW